MYVQYIFSSFSAGCMYVFLLSSCRLPGTSIGCGRGCIRPDFSALLFPSSVAFSRSSLTSVVRAIVDARSAHSCQHRTSSSQQKRWGKVPKTRLRYCQERGLKRLSNFVVKMKLSIHDLESFPSLISTLLQKMHRGVKSGGQAMDRFDARSHVKPGITLDEVQLRLNLQFVSVLDSVLSSS